MTGARVWLIDLDRELETEIDDRAASEVCDARELDRAAAFVDATDARRYLAAHREARLLIAGRLGLDPAALVFGVEPCRGCGGDHGRPVLASTGGDAAHGLWFTLSRSGRWAAVALRHGAPVGVDVEASRPPGALEHLRAEVSPDDAQVDVLRAWVRKEALLKSTGEGLTTAMAALRLRPMGGGVLADRRRGVVHDLWSRTGVVLAVAGPDLSRVEFTDATPLASSVRT